MTLLATIYTTPGFCNEKMDIFLSRGFKEIKNNPDHDEFLHIIRIKLNECIRMIRDGTITDAKTIIGIMLARDHMPGSESEINK